MERDMNNQLVFPVNNVPLANDAPGALNVGIVRNTSSDDLKSWVKNKNLSGQERRAALAELVRRAKNEKSLSTEPTEGDEESSLESLLLVLLVLSESDGADSEEEKKKLAEALDLELADLEGLSPPGPGASTPSEGEID